MGLPGCEDSLTIGGAVSTQYQRMTDGQTDRQTDGRLAYSYKNQNAMIQPEGDTQILCVLFTVG